MSLEEFVDKLYDENKILDIVVKYEYNKTDENYEKYKSKFFKLLIDNSKYHLKGDYEINHPDASEKNYYCILCDDDIKLKAFKLFIQFYYVESLIFKKLYIPIDYEFNTKKIALMQMNFELENNKNSFIFIFYPPELDSSSMEYLKNKIMCNNKIFKILHGSDSLDIPYTFNDFFEGNKENILKFTNTLIDTKYLCEYHHFDNDIQEKCKIKELLLEHQVINQKQYNRLVDNEEKMGNISDIFIDIHNIKDELVKYSLFDVIYLKYLYFKFLNINTDIYENLIPEFTRYVFLERREIIDLMGKLNDIIFRLNLGVIEEFDDNLNNIFMTILYTVYDRKIINLFKINYFKKYILNLLKLILYNILIENYDIKMNNDSKFNGYLNVGSIFKKLREYSLFSIFNLLNYFKESSIEYVV